MDEMSVSIKRSNSQIQSALFIYLFSNIRAKRPLTMCIRTSNKISRFQTFHKISKLYIKLLKSKT